MVTEPEQHLDEFSRSLAEPVFAEFPELREHAQVQDGALRIHFHPGIHGDEVKAFISTEDQEVTIGLGKWHAHFDWPPQSDGLFPHYTDPMAALRGIVADELRPAVRYAGDQWTSSTLLDPSEEPDVRTLKPSESIEVITWSGRNDRVFRAGDA